MTAAEYREYCKHVTQAQIDLELAEYRAWAGESERDAAVRDTDHVVELQSRKGQ